MWGRDAQIALLGLAEVDPGEGCDLVLEDGVVRAGVQQSVAEPGANGPVIRTTMSGRGRIRPPPSEESGATARARGDTESSLLALR
jgi:hypothetical protein